jgi:hypothetical protein
MKLFKNLILVALVALLPLAPTAAIAGNDHGLFDVKAQGLGRVVVSGSFAPNGSSTLAATSVNGAGFSVARTSTGLFTITLNDSYPALIGAALGLQLASGDDKFLQFGSIDVNAKTVQIRVWDVSAAAVADIAANANNRINFVLVFKNTSNGGAGLGAK